MNIYVASSWRNAYQPSVVAALRAAGHEVYDFRHPAPEDRGFAWSEIDPDWERWDKRTFREALTHPIARAGFAKDMNALLACDACVLVLPCGRSAHLEVGWAAGARKRTIVLLAENVQDGKAEPELMYLMCDHLCTTLDEVLEVLEQARWMIAPGQLTALQELCGVVGTATELAEIITGEPAATCQTCGAPVRKDMLYCSGLSPCWRTSVRGGV